MAVPIPDCAIRTQDLRKVYSLRGRHPVEALKGFNLEIPRGSIFGLLGPNGAGKSTFINIIADLVKKTSGTAKVWGYDIDHQRRQASACVGIVPQELTIDPFFTPRETLDLQAGYYGVPTAERQTSSILAALGLADKAETYTRRLSGGMRRRLMVAKALVHQPPVIILDVPTAGVDVELRSQLWEYVRELNTKGTTVVLTTHYLEEAESMCRNIAILNEGEIVAQSSMKALLKKAQHQVLIFECVESLPSSISIKHCECEILDEHSLQISLPESTTISDVITKLLLQNISVANVRSAQNRLENLFLSLTSKAN